MLVKVVLVDINPKMIAAWKETFEENPEVEIVQGSMLDQQVSAWVSPTNSRGSMDGGLDAVIKKNLGSQIETKVQAAIKEIYGKGGLPLGHATSVETGKVIPAYLISTPTMTGSSENISDTLNVALACCAAFQAVHMQNAKVPGGIRSVALPGLGANTGKTPVEICADLMWTAYNMFREKEFTDFGEMRKQLENELGDLTPTSKATPKAQISNNTANVVKNATAAPKTAQKKDEDFDDHE